MTRTKLYLVVALVAALLTAEASASGLVVARFGGEHGHPTTGNATSIYYNPAGLSLLGGTRLFIDGSLAWRSYEYTRPASAIDNVLDGPGAVPGSVGGTPADATGANSGKGSLFNVLAAPFFGATTDFGVKGLGAGVGFYVPIGGQSVWDKQDKVDGYPGAEDGAQRWWVMEGIIRTLYFSAGVAYRYEPLKLSLGATFNMTKSELYTSRARLGSGHDHLVSRTTRPDGSYSDELLEGRAVINLESWDPSIGVGLIWEPADGMFVGLSYQSQPGFGENTLEGDSRKILGVSDEVKDKAEAEQSMPDVIRFGWRMNTGKAEYRLFGDYTRWSVFTEQCIRTKGLDGCDLAIIPRNWEDAFGVRGGYSRWFTDDIEFLLGLGFDQSAVPDSTLEPALVDMDKITASLGARFTLMKDSLAVATTYTQVIYFTREIDARPSGNGQSDVTGTAFADARNPDSAGKYEQAVGVFNLNLEYAF